MAMTQILSVLAMLTCAEAAIGQEQKTPTPQAWPYTFSKETTYVTKPIRKDGTIDYVEAINEKWSQGVTRENNAAIGLLDAIGPGAGRMRAHYAAVREKLGIAAAPDGADGADFVTGAPPQWEKTLTRAWIEQDDPETAKWLASMAPRLNLLVEASKRSRFCMPLVRANEDDLMASILLPHLNEARQMVNALKSRALLSLGKEDGDAFRRDAVAIVRFGRLMAAGPTMVEKLVAVNCESSGLEILKLAATGGWLSDAQVQGILADLRSAPAGNGLFESFELLERGFMLEFIQYAAVHGSNKAQEMLRLMIPNNQKNPAMAVPAVDVGKDWNAALKKVNWWYDRLAEAGKKPTYAGRKEAAEQIERDLAGLRDRQAGLNVALASFEDRAIGLLMASVSRAYETETRLIANRRLTETALALSSFRTGTGEYPEELKQLTPTYFKEEPVDPFTGKGLTYVRQEKGYLLQSLGPAGGGRGRGTELGVRGEK